MRNPRRVLPHDVIYDRVLGVRLRSRVQRAAGVRGLPEAKARRRRSPAADPHGPRRRIRAPRALLTLRARIAAVAALAVTLAVVATAVFTYVAVRSSLRGEIDDSLTDRAGGLGGPGGPGRGRPPGPPPPGRLGPRREPFGGPGLGRPVRTRGRHCAAPAGGRDRHPCQRPGARAGPRRRAVVPGRRRGGRHARGRVHPAPAGGWRRAGGLLAGGGRLAAEPDPGGADRGRRGRRGPRRRAGRGGGAYCARADRALHGPHRAAARGCRPEPAHGRGRRRRTGAPGAQLQRHPGRAGGLGRGPAPPGGRRQPRAAHAHRQPGREHPDAGRRRSPAAHRARPDARGHRRRAGRADQPRRRRRGAGPRKPARQQDDVRLDEIVASVVFDRERRRARDGVVVQADGLRTLPWFAASPTGSPAPWPRPIWWATRSSGAPTAAGSRWGWPARRAVGARSRPRLRRRGSAARVRALLPVRQRRAASPARDWGLPSSPRPPRPTAGSPRRPTRPAAARCCGWASGRCSGPAQAVAKRCRSAPGGRRPGGASRS